MKQELFNKCVIKLQLQFLIACPSGPTIQTIARCKIKWISIFRHVKKKDKVPQVSEKKHFELSVKKTKTLKIHLDKL